MPVDAATEIPLVGFGYLMSCDGFVTRIREKVPVGRTYT